MDQKKQTFNTDNIVRVIDAWTNETIREKLKEQDRRLNKQLIPELKKELAVKEMQERALARMESDHEVRNIAARFVLSLKGGLFEDAYDCFALKTQGTKAVIEKYGVYEGAEQLKAYFVDYYRKLGGSEGCFIEHELTTPVVEIAEDNMTAKAMFLSEGVLAIAPESWMETHEAACSLWQIGPWYMELIKEDGLWKIWHLTIYDDIETPYEQSWSTFKDHDYIVHADAPEPSCAVPDQNYFTAHRKPYLHKEPPCAYKTYDDNETNDGNESRG